ncbi:MAG TPA: PqqD family protein [Methylomirabilota bacterium]|nr:PqqD family protein [Methylomirabilota bacterium]
MPETYPAQNPRAAWRIYDGEAVIVSPEDSTLHTLNAVGTLIWEAADGRTALDAIVGRVCEAFDVDAATAARDTAVFVDALTHRGLLTMLDAPRPAA